MKNPFKYHIFLYCSSKEEKYAKRLQCKLKLYRYLSRDKQRILFENMRYHCGLGGSSKGGNPEREAAIEYARMLIHTKGDQYFLDFLFELFELTKDMYIKIGVVSEKTRTVNIHNVPFDGNLLFRATEDSGTISYIIKGVYENEVPYSSSEDTFDICVRMIRILAYYNSHICTPYGELPSLAFEDLQDFNTIDLSEDANNLKFQQKVNTKETLETSAARISESIVQAKDINKFDYVTGLFVKQLQRIRPDAYNNLSDGYKMHEYSYPLGACSIKSVSDSE